MTTWPPPCAAISGTGISREERTRRALAEELGHLGAQEPPPAEDPNLLDELPLIPVILEGIPEELARELLAAFTLMVEYDELRDELRLSATITESLAMTIQPHEPNRQRPTGRRRPPFPVLSSHIPVSPSPSCPGRLGRLRRLAARLPTSRANSG